MNTRPNILLLYTDQQRSDSLGCYGSPWAVSPNVDKLAAGGARLTDYHVNSPVCAPSRMSFLSGRYPSSVGVGANGYEFPDRVVPLHAILKAHGYHTANFGKLHFEPHCHRDHTLPPKSFGFDELVLSDEPGCYDDAYIQWVRQHDAGQVPLCRAALPPAAARSGVSPAYDAPPREVHQPYVFQGREDMTHSAFVSDLTCRFLREREQEKPFFAIAGFYAPHTPVNPPARFLEMFDAREMRLPVLAPGEQMQPFLADIDHRQWQEIARHYYALCAHVDDCVGRILETLDAQGLRENTIVVFTSDHGEYLGDHGRVQKSMPGQDCISRVPFIVRHPQEIPPGLVRSSLAEGVDFAASVLDWCGIECPEYLQGNSMRNWLRGGDDVHRDSILIEYFLADGSGASATVKTKDYSYFQDAVRGREMLFHRKDDPGDGINIAADPQGADALDQMRYLLARKLQTARCSGLPRIAEY